MAKGRFHGPSGPAALVQLPVCRPPTVRSSPHQLGAAPGVSHLQNSRLYGPRVLCRLVALAGGRLPGEDFPSPVSTTSPEHLSSGKDGRTAPATLGSSTSMSAAHDASSQYTAPEVEMPPCPSGANHGCCLMDESCTSGQVRRVPAIRQRQEAMDILLPGLPIYPGFLVDASSDSLLLEADGSTLGVQIRVRAGRETPSRLFGGSLVIHQ